MIVRSNKEVISFLMKAGLPDESNKQPQTRFVQQQQQPAKKERLVESREEVGAAETANGQQPAQPPKPKPQPIRVEAKIGRNDPCPCGSGKKYKNCHGVGVA